MQKKVIINYLNALRLERWPRSFAIYIGTFSYFLFYPSSIELSVGFFLKLFLSFLFTWGISTSNYIINEIADAPFDKHHPIKKNKTSCSWKSKSKSSLYPVYNNR